MKREMVIVFLLVIGTMIVLNQNAAAKNEPFLMNTQSLVKTAAEPTCINRQDQNVVSCSEAIEEGKLKIAYRNSRGKIIKTKVLEAKCSSDGTLLYRLSCVNTTTLRRCETACNYGCTNGSCRAPVNTSTCTDSDGGVNYMIKGEVNLVHSDGSISGGTDCCTNGGYACVEEGNYLSEKKCGTNTVDYEIYRCPHGCRDGACLADVTNTTNTTTCSVEPYCEGNVYRLCSTTTNCSQISEPPRYVFNSMKCNADFDKEAENEARALYPTTVFIEGCESICASGEIGVLCDNPSMNYFSIYNCTTISGSEHWAKISDWRSGWRTICPEGSECFEEIQNC